VDRVIDGLLQTKLIEPEDLDRILTTYLIDVDYSYPVPTLDRNAALGTIQPYLAANGIASRGRFGAWKYEIGNMDHSVMQGVEVVNRWLRDEPEVTWTDVPESARSHALADDIPPSRPGHGRVTTLETGPAIPTAKAASPA
jgi:hypothetical protein